jgi:hypothetical protein
MVSLPLLLAAVVALIFYYRSKELKNENAEKRRLSIYFDFRFAYCVGEISAFDNTNSANVLYGLSNVLVGYTATSGLDYLATEEKT